MASNSVLKRLEKVERKFKGKLGLKWLVAIKDTDGLYSGACGKNVTEEQYNFWLSRQRENNRVIFVEIVENKPQNPAGEDICE